MKQLPPWLDGARYEGDMDCILPYVDVYTPASITVQHQRYRGRQQCEFVIALLDSLGVPGKISHGKM